MPTIFTSSSTEDVTITQAGTYTVTSLQSANSVVLDSPGATLVLDAPLDVAAGFTFEAGTLAFDGGTLSVGSYDQTGGAVTGNAIDIVAAGSFAMVGSLGFAEPASISLTGSSIAITGSAYGSDGGSGTTSLIATIGTIETGTLIAGTLSGGSTTDATSISAVSLDTAEPITLASAVAIETDGVVSQTAIAAVPSISAVTPLLPIIPVTPITVNTPATPVFLPAAVPPVTPPVPLVAPLKGADPASSPYGGGLVTAEALGLDPAQLAGASGAGPDAPDVWQAMTSTDISGTDGALEILLNPVDQTWVALTLQQAGAFNSGVVTTGGPIASLGQFLSSEQAHPTQPAVPVGGCS